MAGTMVQLAASIGTIDTADNLTIFSMSQRAFVVNGAKLYVADFSAAGTPTWAEWAATSGTMPGKAYLGCCYRGRAVLSGNPDYPHMWYMSAVGDPFNWAYAGETVTTAIAGHDGDSAQLGDIVKALIPYHDDYLIIGCAHSLQFMSGDPASGGAIDSMDDTSGIVGDKSWCWDGNKNLYLLTTTGLSIIGPGFQQPKSLTAETYPQFMIDLAFDPALHRILLSWDKDNCGILITKTTLNTGANSEWWYDLRTGGLFKESYPSSLGVYSSCRYDESTTPANRGLLLGTAAGFICRFDNAAESDVPPVTGVPVAIPSNIVLGPIPLSRYPRSEGIISNIDAVLAGTSADSNVGNLAYGVYTGRTAEEAVKNTTAGQARILGTIYGPGRKQGGKQRQRARGRYATIKLLNNAVGKTWGFENIVADVEEAGRII